MNELVVEAPHQMSEKKGREKRERQINDVHDEHRFTLDDSLTAVWSISQGATKQ